MIGISNSITFSHAEVIARRAFLLFLNSELRKINKGKESRYFIKSDGMISVKNDVSFHLYVSLAPCNILVINEF